MILNVPLEKKRTSFIQTRETATRKSLRKLTRLTRCFLTLQKNSNTTSTARPLTKQPEMAGAGSVAIHLEVAVRLLGKILAASAKAGLNLILAIFLVICLAVKGSKQQGRAA